MIKKNHAKGFGFEHRFVKRLLKNGAKKAFRHYGSRGIMDVEWVDQLGFKNEAQLKFSSVKVPKVSKKEIERIKPYAEKKKLEGIRIWIIRKMAHGDEVWELQN